MKRTFSVLWLFLLVLTAFSQSAAAPTFDVASIKRDPTTAGSMGRYLPNGISFLSWMKQVIQMAYNVKAYQVIGGPSWLTTDWYAIDAKTSIPNATKDDLNAMLQTLLTERFKLQMHQETKDFEAYDLVPDKGGAKLTPLKDEERSKCNGTNSAFCGVTSPAMLAGGLAGIIGHPVFDKTGIAGKYDILLDFDTYAFSGRTPPDGYAKPSLNTALKEQLGLTLERHIEPLPVLVIDHIERPADN